MSAKAFDPDPLPAPRSLRLWLGLLCAAWLCMAVGCRHAPLDIGTELPVGESVAVIDQDADFALVRTNGGQQGYVPRLRLQVPPGRADDANASPARVLTAPTALWAQPPDAGFVPPPRSVKEINAERDQLNGLYLSQDEQRQMLAPRGRGPFFDQQSGEIMWPAIECANPQCPGLASGQPAIFANVLSGVAVRPDGTLYKAGDPRSPLAPGKPTGCPHCTEGSIRPHLLPETAVRMEKLNDEHRRRLAADRN